MTKIVTKIKDIKNNRQIGQIIILIYSLFYQLPHSQAEDAESKSPKMSYELNSIREGGGWEESKKFGYRIDSKIEYLPIGETRSNFNEMVTMSFGHEIDVKTYLQKWLIGMRIVGAEIQTKLVAEGNYMLVSYKTKTENGIWKFSQGEDGTYGVGYSFKPNKVKLKDVEQWVKEIKEAKLSK